MSRERRTLERLGERANPWKGLSESRRWKSLALHESIPQSRCSDSSAFSRTLHRQAKLRLSQYSSYFSPGWTSCRSRCLSLLKRDAGGGRILMLLLLPCASPPVLCLRCSSWYRQMLLKLRFDAWSQRTDCIVRNQRAGKQCIRWVKASRMMSIEGSPHPIDPSLNTDDTHSRFRSSLMARKSARRVGNMGLLAWKPPGSSNVA
ncbi:hypothetical protein IWX90DRAFT_431702, partial [Phyllosticta citrichinensis]